MDDPKIKLLICYHKKAPLFKDEILTPIHVGRALAEKRMDLQSEEWKWLEENLIGDDTGENISDKNSSYNEMTAIYWAWKNYDELGNPDYIGLMHYRRHFILDDKNLDVFNVRDFDEETYLDILNYSPEKLAGIVEGCDFLPHIGKVNNVYKHYTENQRKEDIDLANRIILEKYPEYKETMKKYYSGNYSNFCNMCIFSRKLFFKYCEWIFSVLEEFERRVDMSEKRFFISERLTGIFVAKLMEDESLKYKKLPIAFIDEPAKVPVVMYLNEETVFDTAMSVESILRNSDNYNTYQFYFICPENADESLKEKIRLTASKHEKYELTFMESEVDEELLPLYIPELLPKINKCIYISGSTIALKDIGEFYRICSVDDYFAVGIPETKYDPAEKEKKVSAELLVLNSKRMHAHKLAGKIKAEDENTDGCGIFNEICKGEIGYIPWYLFTSEKIELDSEQLYYSNKLRNDIKEQAMWRPFLIYDRANPLENNQGIYASFWWENIIMLPLSLQIIKPNLYVLEELYCVQQMEINDVAEGRYKGALGVRYGDFASADIDPATGQQEWQSYGTLGKLKFYYEHNGLKKTVAYGCSKIFGGSR